jgi:hypothetical protein
MKKHVDVDHFSLKKKLVKDLNIALAKTSFNQEANKEMGTCISIYNIWVFFY